MPTDTNANVINKLIMSGIPNNKKNQSKRSNASSTPEPRRSTRNRRKPNRYTSV